MAEKSKKPVEDKVDTDKQFLDKHGVRDILRSLVSQLTANRPSDPLQFMADYFQSSTETVNELEKCHQILLLAHHSRPVFQKNVTVAYEILSQTKVKKSSQGVVGQTYDELLNLLLRDFPTKAHIKLKQVLSKQHYEVVRYEDFNYGVTTIAIMQDFLNLAKQLFIALDVKNFGSLDRQYAEIFLKQLHIAFAKIGTKPSSNLESCYCLAPDRLYAALTSISKSNYGRSTLSIDQFEELAAETFLISMQSTLS